MGGARAGQPDAQGLWEHEKAQGHRVGNLPRVFPLHGTQGPREGVLWGLSLIPGNGLEGSHSLSAQKPVWILGAPPLALCPGGSLSSLMELKVLLMTCQNLIFFRANLTSLPRTHSLIQATALY